MVNQNVSWLCPRPAVCCTSDGSTNTSDCSKCSVGHHLLNHTCCWKLTSHKPDLFMLTGKHIMLKIHMQNNSNTKQSIHRSTAVAALQQDTPGPQQWRRHYSRTRQVHSSGGGTTAGHARSNIVTERLMHLLSSWLSESEVSGCRAALMTTDHSDLQVLKALHYSTGMLCSLQITYSLNIQ